MDYNIIYEKGLLHNLSEYEELKKISSGNYDEKNLKYINLINNENDITKIKKLSSSDDKLYIKNPLLIVRKGKEINLDEIKIEIEFINGSKIFQYKDFRYYFSFNNNFIRFFIKKEEASFQRDDGGIGYTEGFSVISNDTGGYILYDNGELSEKFDGYTITPPSWNDTTDSPFYVTKNGLYNIVGINGKLISNKFLPFRYLIKRCTKRGDESRRSYSTFLSENKLEDIRSSGLPDDRYTAISVFNEKYRN